MSGASLLRLFHTVRHLRPVQIHGRVTFRLARPSPDFAPAPKPRDRTGQWALPARREHSLLAPWRFRLLNEEHEVADAASWDDPEWSKLWRYHLHYFDDLNAADAPERAEWHRVWLSRWIAENPPGTGSGWEPYPTSLRIVNWVKWALAGNALPLEAVESLAVQARWLTRRLEYHLLGNHLFSNAKALVFAGLYFQGHEAERWLRAGLGILAREVPEQILADGGHFERSPMYHALALEDVLDLCNVAAAYDGSRSQALSDQVAAWRARVPSMRRWLWAMCHPDGEIGFFNDAAMGMAPEPSELERYARQLGFGDTAEPERRVLHLERTGYIRVAIGDLVALLDTAPVGPDYLPGHAHADTLSFECSLFGHRVIVNTGTSVYGEGAERQRQRGTPAHSTVTLEGRDSSEVWAGFRVARRARPFGLWISDQAPGVQVRCAHDGYRTLPGRPVHIRQWHATSASLMVTDRIEGPFYEAVARFHLHPDVRVEVFPAGQRGLLRFGTDRVCRWCVSGGVAEAVEGTWHPRFGSSEPNRCLEVRLRERACTTVFEWS